LKVGPPTTLPIPAMDMLSAFGSIWVSQPDRVARIDPATGRVTATIPVPGTSDFRDLAAGAGALWVSDTGMETVTRIDPVRNHVTATISIRAHLFVVDALAFIDGKLWVVRPVPNDESKGDVLSIDPATNRIAQRALIPRTFDVMSSGAHALWYVRDTNLLRFDTRNLRATIVRHDAKVMLAAANQRVWLLTPSGVIEADEQTGRQIGPPIAIKDTVNLAAAVGPSSVWLASQPDSSSDGNVQPYDLITHRPLAAPTRIGFPIVAITALPSSLWIDADGITRISYSR
jgi:DNA-binding beta-propeller fold protein YncE